MKYQILLAVNTATQEEVSIVAQFATLESAKSFFRYWAVNAPEYDEENDSKACWDFDTVTVTASIEPIS